MVRNPDVEAFAEKRAVAIDARDGEAVRQTQLDLGAEEALHLRLAASAREEERIAGRAPRPRESAREGERVFLGDRDALGRGPGASSAGSSLRKQWPRAVSITPGTSTRPSRPA